MSRVGKKPIDIPAKVKIEIKGSVVTAEGPKGKLEHKVPDGIKVTQKEKTVVVERTSSEPNASALHGLTRTMIANMLKGVTEGYTKNLEIKGVGFKAQAQGQELQITLGFSHPVRYKVPEGVTVATPKPVQIVVSGTDKVKVGETAAEIRDYFQPEPYTGKGIMYVGEYVRRKAGKTVTK
ncbi:50S ribosomal protein L6 [Candidatus Omnitrophota bacterium]